MKTIENDVQKGIVTEENKKLRVELVEEYQLNEQHRRMTSGRMYRPFSFEDFFISSHLRPTEDLLNDIYTYLDKVKDDREKIESIYKVVKALANE